MPEELKIEPNVEAVKALHNLLVNLTYEAGCFGAESEYLRVADLLAPYMVKRGYAITRASTPAEPDVKSALQEVLASRVVWSDKDNMEFDYRLTCFTVDKMKAALQNTQQPAVDTIEPTMYCCGVCDSDYDNAESARNCCERGKLPDGTHLPSIGPTEQRTYGRRGWTLDDCEKYGMPVHDEEACKSTSNDLCAHIRELTAQQPGKGLTEKEADRAAALVKFLRGQEAFDDVWFGEWKDKRPYWWRDHLKLFDELIQKARGSK